MDTLNQLGDCRDEELVESLFSSVSEFARLVEERGDEFQRGTLVVTYDKVKDIHTFFRRPVRQIR